MLHIKIIHFVKNIYQNVCTVDVVVKNLYPHAPCAVRHYLYSIRYAQYLYTMHRYHWNNSYKYITVLCRKNTEIQRFAETGALSRHHFKMKATETIAVKLLHYYEQFASAAM